MKKIPLTKGKFALVDDEDYDQLIMLDWCCQSSNNGHYRAVTRPDSKKRAIKMHRFILNAPPGLVVDHINGNPLDNRRCNLRLATQLQNTHNRNKSTNNTSGYKGVWKRCDGRAKKWTAEIKVAGVKHFLGGFFTPEEAAKAYNIAALKFHKEFAQLNVITK